MSWNDVPVGGGFSLELVGRENYDIQRIRDWVLSSLSWPESDFIAINFGAAIGGGYKLGTIHIIERAALFNLQTANMGESVSPATSLAFPEQYLNSDVSFYIGRNNAGQVLISSDHPIIDIRPLSLWEIR